MKTRGMERLLGAANPVGRGRLDGLDLEALEADLLADMAADFSAPPELEAARPRHPRRFVLALGSAALVVALAAVVFVAGGGSNRASQAYGAELVRFAESTPLLLLEGPGWRVQNVNEMSGREGTEGTMEFVTGKPIPYESVRITGDEETGWRESGMFPATVRQRRVELRWFHGSLAGSISTARTMPHPHGQGWVKAPVLGTTASVDTRAEFYVNQGGPGNRQMTALWSEDGYLLEMRAAVADMLEGIPVPSTFKPSRVPDEGLTTDRYQVGAAVTGTVSCLWLRQWGEARRTGDGAKEVEAEKAMATSRRWPILREMAKDGAYPETIWELAAEMPSGHWEWAGHVHPLLPRAEGLGCARWGIPVLPPENPQP